MDHTNTWRSWQVQGADPWSTWKKSLKVSIWNNECNARWVSGSCIWLLGLVTSSASTSWLGLSFQHWASQLGVTCNCKMHDNTFHHAHKLRPIFYHLMSTYAYSDAFTSSSLLASASLGSFYRLHHHFWEKDWRTRTTITHVQHVAVVYWVYFVTFFFNTSCTCMLSRGKSHVPQSTLETTQQALRSS